MAGPRRSTRGGASEDNSAAWLTTYGDMVTLLMCFFVLLYAMSSVDIAKFKAFVEGLVVPFGNEAGEGLLPESDGLTPEEAPDVVPPEELVPDVSTETLNPEVTADMIDQAAAAEEAMDTLDEVSAALDAALTDAGLQDLVEQRREERGLIVSVASDDVLFALGSTEISAIGARVIKVVTATLGDFSNDVLVEGHTDDLPLSRRSYTNWNLSTDRAVAVLSRMIDRHQFPAERIGAVGYGEFRPLVENSGRSNRARNRRVDFVVLRDDVTSETIG